MKTSLNILSKMKRISRLTTVMSLLMLASPVFAGTILAKVSFGPAHTGLSSVTYTVVSPTDGTTVIAAATSTGVVEVKPGGASAGDYQVYVSDTYVGDTIFWNSGETTPAYASGTLNPPPPTPAQVAAVILANPSNLLTTNGSGQVVASQVSGNVTGNLGGNVVGSVGSVPHVTVAGYDSGQDPASYILVTPANKIATDSSHAISLPTTAPTGYGGSGTAPTAAAIVAALMAYQIDPLGSTPLTFLDAQVKMYEASVGPYTQTISGLNKLTQFFRNNGTTQSYQTNNTLNSNGAITNRTTTDQTLPN